MALEWWQKTVIYQIYPRSYNDTNADGVGDIKGIIEKLDYLADLGVETLWISPFFESPQTDFGYDISDYCSVNPEYGTMDDVDTLIEEAHARGLKIVLDLVLNHTSIEHEWFKESRSSRDNPKSDWYIWRDGAGEGSPPNNWIKTVGGSGWNYDETRDQWFYSSFLSFQPDLNYRNPKVKSAMLGIVKFWMDKDVDGFRLDIFNSIFKDADFQDNPFSITSVLPSETSPHGFFQLMKNTVNHPDTFAFARELRAFIDTHPGGNKFILGEVFGDHEILKSFLGSEQSGLGLNLTFIFETLGFRFKANFFKRLIADFEKHYGNPRMPVWVFANHDRPRFTTRLKGSFEKAKLVALVQLTVRGVPVIYYGEEIGMKQGGRPIKESQDSLAQMYSWVPQILVSITGLDLNRDNTRTPMQWTTDPKNAGFTDERVEPWNPVPQGKEVGVRNVEAQRSDQNSLLNCYKALLGLRRESPALHAGDIRLLDTHDNQPSVLAYARFAEGSDPLVVYVNFSNKKVSLDLRDDFEHGSTQQLAFSTGRVDVDKEAAGHSLTLGAYAGVVVSSTGAAPGQAREEEPGNGCTIS